jgi:hypothetical protein
MRPLSSEIRLRPTRIGFLVNPTDVKQVRMVMRYCACLWGGRYNPIIPASLRSPAAWQPTKKWHWRPSGWELARRYIRFFEPDLFVDVTNSATAKLSLTAARKFSAEANSVIPLADFVDQDDRAFAAFAVGQDVFDLYRHLYRTKFQFMRRTPPPMAIFQERRNRGDMAFFEAVYGCFPSDSPLKRIQKAYLDVFQPTTYVPSAETFTQRWGNCAGPLWVGSQGLERGYTSLDEPVIFVFDPSLGTDLIDFWNLRLFTRTVLPINVQWIKQSEHLIVQTVIENHRPMRNNPQGLMHRTTIEFASSISEERAKDLVKDHVRDAPRGALTIKLFYSSIWDISKEDWYVKPSPIPITADDRDAEIQIEAESDYAWVDSLAPKFADRFGGNARWANVLRIRPPFDGGENRTLCSPPDDIPEPHASTNEARFSKEGVVTLAKYLRHRTLLIFPRGDDQICKWLETKGLRPRISNAGRMTKQVIDALGGLRGVRLIADVETVQELNRMAASRSIREDAMRGIAIDENPPKTSAHSTWVRIAKARTKSLWNTATIDELTSARVMQIGLSLKCSHCYADNWFSLIQLGYELQCQRCLKGFAFPQAEVGHKWFYRPLGAFAVPDYAAGGYATALALRLLSGGAGVGSDDHHFVYSTGIDFDGQRREIDFVAWRQDLTALGPGNETVVLFGEAKSFAAEAIKDKDCELLREMGQRFPGAFLVASVMKDRLSSSEKKLLANLATWGRMPGTDGMPRAPLIVLTGTELFADGGIKTMWEKLGGSYKQALDTFVGQFNLWKLADCSQQVYLGLPPYSEWRRKRYERRRKPIAKG